MVFDFEDFGNRAIKGLKMSPDGFVQMAYQLAYFRHHSGFSSTYESCMVKQVRHRPGGGARVADGSWPTTV